MKPPPNNFDDYMDKINKVKLSPDRKNLKPVNPKLTTEQLIKLAVKEGNALLEAEAKAKPSVKPSNAPVAAQKLSDALATMSDNPYIRARIEILNKMSVKERRQIELMEKDGSFKTSHQYETFVHDVAMRGDQLSPINKNRVN